MSLSPGANLGPYTIDREIGRGGMGVVYLGRDTRLDRAVAIKELPEHLAGVPDRLARFEREARLLAQLNHPNVAGIHGVEEHGGARYLILEFVGGETLAERLDRGALAVDEALEIAVQIAAGVEAAHDSGVVHRDLKPGNVMVTPEGQAKVLDFGLARVDEVVSSGGSLTESPTMTSPVGHSPTVEGVILGTAAYMSPEQARGRPVDKRTDIWSFGVVLFEMLTGASPFVGETVSDSIGAVLHKEPDLGLLPSSASRRVRHVLGRCLARDKHLRYRDIGDVRIELMPGAELEEPPVPEAKGSRGLVWGLTGALALAIAGLVFLLVTSRTPSSAIPAHVSIEPPADARVLFSGDLAGPPVVSPDGRRIAFCAARESERRRLWVRDLGETAPRELAGTDGALFPFWSPDGREIGFFTPNSVRRFDLASGTAQRVCEADQGRGATWTEDGRIVFARSFRGGLWVVDVRGGAAVPLTEVDGERHTSHRWPVAIPGTDLVLYSAVSARAGHAEHNGIYLGSLGGDREPVRLMRSDYRAEYHDGHLLHVRDGVLLASELDLARGEVSGSASVIARDVAADLSTWHGQFSASGAGVLVFNRRRETDGLAENSSGYAWAVEGDRITSFDYEGRANTAYAIDTPIRGMALSPDGRTLAIEVVSEDGFLDIWLHPTAWTPGLYGRGALEVARVAVTSPEPRRFTFLEGPEVRPAWSPDSREIAFRWAGDGARPNGIYRKRVGGGTEVLIRDNSDAHDYPTDWTSDGRHIVIVTGTQLTTELNDIWAIPLDGGEEIPLVVAPGPDYDAKVSPDGRWLAYATVTSGRPEIYVIPFAPAWPEGAGNRRWLVSENGGRVPRWSREGDELFYLTDASVLVALDVDGSGDSFSFSTPRALFQTPWDVGRSYDPTPEGDTFPNSFMFLDGGADEDAPISVILNWRSLLAR